MEQVKEFTIEEKFQACVDIIQSMPKSGPLQSTYVEMLTMYGLYRQVKSGPCHVPQPFWNLIERFKWDAWNRMGELPREDAMDMYVHGVLEKIDYCAQNWDWEEMFAKCSKDYKRLEPVLREKFRIIDREWIKDDGTFLKPEPRKQVGHGVLNFNSRIWKGEHLGDPRYTIEEKFNACVDIIHSMPKTGPAPVTYIEMLGMYGLYKQALEGPCRTRQPGFWNYEGRCKWDAWKKLGDMSKEEAMYNYVAHVLAKGDFMAEKVDWDEMFERFRDLYDKLEPILRIKFRILGREYITEDGKFLKPPPKEKHELYDFITNKGIRRMNPKPVEFHRDESTTPNDPFSDGEYCDARDDLSPPWSRRSSVSFSSQSRKKKRSIREYCSRMDMELRTITTTLNNFMKVMENRHQMIMKMMKNSGLYIAVPSRLSWRSIFFFLIWPFIIIWAQRFVRYYII